MSIVREDVEISIAVDAASEDELRLPSGYQLHRLSYRREATSPSPVRSFAPGMANVATDLACQMLEEGLTIERSRRLVFWKREDERRRETVRLEEPKGPH